MVEVFHEVRRVLRDDGTLWLNIGDSYAANRSSRVSSTKGEVKHDPGQSAGGRGVQVSASLQPKDLIGIPWMLAFALRADGWYLRQDIVRSKTNPMPESVRDRCTKSHEYIFLLSKSERYYFDSDAIAEPLATSSIARLRQDVSAQAGSKRVPGKTNGPMKAVFRKSGNLERKPHPGAPDIHGGKQAGSIPWEGCTRNKRDVWTVTTQPFKGPHFATFPPKLIEPCVLAGCPEGGVVLDPFIGSGTTGMVASRLGRHWVGCELNPSYVTIAEARIATDETSRELPHEG
jgi:DNA modification methylase